MLPQKHDAKRHRAKSPDGQVSEPAIKEEAMASMKATELAVAIRDAVVQADSEVDLLKRVVYSVFGVHQASHAYLGQLDSDANLRVCAHYGYPRKDDLPGQGQSVWRVTAPNDALRSGKTTFFPSWSSLLEKYPQYDDESVTGDAFLAIPLWLKGSPAALLCVVFKRPVDSDAIQDVEQRAASLRFVLETALWQPRWLSGLTEMPSNRQPSDLLGRREGLTRVSATDSGAERAFSAREIVILGKIAEGFTNREIASWVHLSPSSIGKEIMKIFVTLNVSDRRSAVREARHKGLLPPEKVEIPVTVVSSPPPSSRKSHPELIPTSPTRSMVT